MTLERPQRYFIFSDASGEQTTIPTSLLTHVVDQATLNTMQAEMIAVQVLSQSATGDVQFFQQQANAQVVPVTTLSGVDLQNSLTQVCMLLVSTMSIVKFVVK